MHFIEKEPVQKRKDFVDKLKSGKILRVPGAYNPLTAKLIEEIGYDAVYVSGGVMANDLGFPDIGLTTLQDVSTRSYLISRVTNLPTIVDIDTGFKSCRETIQTFRKESVKNLFSTPQLLRGSAAIGLPAQKQIASFLIRRPTKWLRQRKIAGTYRL